MLTSQCKPSFIKLPNKLGSFSNDDGNGNENVIQKHKFTLLQSLRDYSKLFDMTKVWLPQEWNR